MAVLLFLQLIFATLITPTLSVPTEVESRAAAPIVTNGGFETGKLAPWVFSPFYKINKASYEITKPGLTTGRYKFEYDAHTVYDPEAEGVDAGFKLAQNITLVKGASYSISLSYLNQPRGSAGETTAQFYISVGGSHWGSTYAPKNKVSTFKRTFVADRANPTLAIYFYSDPYYSYDNIQMTQLDDVQIRKL